MRLPASASTALAYRARRPRRRGCQQTRTMPATWPVAMHDRSRMRYGLNLAHIGDPDDGRARCVRGGEVHLGADAPVVIAGRVVEDLPYRPPAGLLVDDQQGRAAGIGPGTDLVVFGEIRLDDLLPRIAIPPGLGIQ